MGDSFKKVQSGQPLRIPAATFNTFIDAARDFQQRQRNALQMAQRSSNQEGIILVKNNSGGDCPRFGILGIDGVLHDPTANLDQFKNNAAIVGITPSEVNHKGKFVILTEPIKNGLIGRARISGISCVQVNVVSESHTHADVQEGQTGHLKSGTSGLAMILWKESGTGVKWALVRIGGGSGGGGAFKIWLIVDPYVSDGQGNALYAYYKCRDVVISADHYGLDNYDPFQDADPEAEPFVVMNMSERGESSVRALSQGDFLVGQEFTDSAGNTVRIAFSDAYAWIHE